MYPMNKKDAPQDAQTRNLFYTDIRVIELHLVCFKKLVLVLSILSELCDTILHNKHT